MRDVWDRLLTTLRRLTYVVFQNEREDDLATELDFHRELKIREHEALGAHVVMPKRVRGVKWATKFARVRPHARSGCGQPSTSRAAQLESSWWE